MVERLQPFGVGNPEPVFAARGVRLLAPGARDEREARETQIGFGIVWRTLRRCTLGFDGPNAIRWQLAKAGDLRRAGLAHGRALAKRDASSGETYLDIAFTLGENDHPEFGGLELTLRDFKTKNAVEAGIQSDPIPASSVLPAS